VKGLGHSDKFKAFSGENSVVVVEISGIANVEYERQREHDFVFNTLLVSP